MDSSKLCTIVKWVCWHCAKLFIGPSEHGKNGEIHGCSCIQVYRSEGQWLLALAKIRHQLQASVLTKVLGGFGQSIPQFVHSLVSFKMQPSPSKYHCTKLSYDPKTAPTSAILRIFDTQRTPHYIPLIQLNSPLDHQTSVRDVLGSHSNSLR